MKAKKAEIVTIDKEYLIEDSKDIYDDAFFEEDTDIMNLEEQGFMLGYLGDCYV